MRKSLLFWLVLFCITQESSAQFEGATFEERKRAYLDDQGKKWERSYPYSSRQPVFAWLERPTAENRGRISEEIGYLTSDNCPDEFGGWENCWFTGDHPSTIICSRILFQYYYKKSVISEADAQKLKSRLEEIPNSGKVQEVIPAVWCAVSNFHFRYLIPAYLYTHIVTNVGQVYYPKPDPQYYCPQPFEYNGRRYEGGKHYDAKTIYYDYVSFLMDEWLRNGTEEDLAPCEYYAAQLHSIALLYDFSPHPALRNKAKLLMDWLLFNYAISFSSNHLAGGHGRHYRAYECSSQDSFPFSIMYNLDPNTIEQITRGIIFTEFYVTGYRQPQLLVDIIEAMISPNSREGDDFYRIVRGHVPALGGKNFYSVLPTAMRYDYITRNYNLGGANFGTGWELNIKGEDIPFKLFINTQPMPPDMCSWGSPSNQAFTLGQYGYQHRNAMFIDASGHLYQMLDRNAWDEQSSESGWQFFREGRVAVAVKMSSTCALEVGTIGVDYPSYDAFKTAIKNNSELTRDYFKTSKGVRISRGYVDYGADFTKLPFDRLEVWEGHAGRNDEKKIVDWNNNIMSVSQSGQTLVYDFNRWVYAEDGDYNPPDSQPPTAPAGFKVAP